MTDTSESMGITHTVDWYAALIEDQNMKDENKQMIKILKSRYAPIIKVDRWMVGVDKEKQLITEPKGEALKTQSGAKVEMEEKPSSDAKPARAVGDPVKFGKFKEFKM